MTTAAIRRRVLTVTAGAFALTLGLATPALAHVTINPATADKGGFTKIAFRVPNERDDASTTKLEVRFPTDNPLPFVSVKPVPGWDVKLTRGKLPAPVVETHVSLFDGTNAGMAMKDRPVFSVQHHPEASPGPTDSLYLFQRFADHMDALK